MGNGYFMEDQTLFATTDMAWLVGEDEADATWVPQSVILNTDIDEIDQVGYEWDTYLSGFSAAQGLAEARAPEPVAAPEVDGAEEGVICEEMLLDAFAR